MRNVKQIARVCRNLGFDFSLTNYRDVEFYRKFHADSGYETVKGNHTWAVYAVDGEAKKWKTAGDRICVAIISRPWYSLAAPLAAIFETPFKYDLNMALAPYVSEIVDPRFSPSIERQNASGHWLVMPVEML